MSSPVPTTTAAAPAASESKVVRFNGIDVTVDLSTPIGVVAAAVALHSMDDKQQLIYESFAASNVDQETFCQLISGGLIKDLKEKIKDLAKPDHDAAWRATTATYGGTDHTVQLLWDMMGDIKRVLNFSSEAYNTANDAKIKPILIEGGTSSKRAIPDGVTTVGRNYVKAGAVLLASGITSLHATANGKTVHLTLRKAKDTNPANGSTVEFKNGSGTWADIGTLRSALVAMYPAGANVPNAWDTFKVKDGENMVTLAKWYDANLTIAEKESPSAEPAAE